MHDFYADPDARPALIPVCAGLAVGFCTGVAVGLLVGVQVMKGLG